MMESGDVTVADGPAEHLQSAVMPQESKRDEKLAPYQRCSFVASLFAAPPSARDLLHHQPRAGPAGCFSAQLLWQRLGGVGNSEQQVVVWSSHRASDPARGPLWENHSRRQHWRDRAPRKRYGVNVIRGEQSGIARFQSCIFQGAASELVFATSPCSSSAGPLSDTVNDPRSQVC